jgi:signal transduction histidine kinase
MAVTMRPSESVSDNTESWANADTGVGIEPELLPRMFERFWRADPSTSPAREGLGLGLSIVRRLVELHGGTIEAHSAGTGAGTRMTVRLPLASGLDAPHDQPAF